MITGPRLLTKINFDDTDIIIYPEYYFYPYNWNEKDRENETFKDSYAIHKWECHWAKKYYEKNTSIITNTFSKIYKDFSSSHSLVSTALFRLPSPKLLNNSKD